MCNLYSAGPSPNEDRSAWDRQVRARLAELASSRIYPGSPGVVARKVEDEPRAEIMTWGFVRDFVAKPINNARDDKLSGRMWAKAFRERRCIIPVRWFVEWHQGARRSDGKKRVLSIRSADKDAWLWMAGLWERNDDGAHYTMITTSANEWMAPIHDRMPAILSPSEIEPWLAEGDPEMIRPFGGELKLEGLANTHAAPGEGAPPDPRPVQGEFDL